MPLPLSIHEGEAPRFRICHDRVELRTEERQQSIDLTVLVAERVRRSGVAEGTVNVQTRHATTAIRVSDSGSAPTVPFGASETLNVVGGKLDLGWSQRIFLVELDGPRRRSISISIAGLAAGASGAASHRAGGMG